MTRPKFVNMYDAMQPETSRKFGKTDEQNLQNQPPIPLWLNNGCDRHDVLKVLLFHLLNTTALHKDTRRICHDIK